VGKVSIVKLHEQTKTLTFNQIAIESIRKLVLTILKNESKAQCTSGKGFKVNKSGEIKFHI
jgi:hypothetical protein